MQGCLYRCKHPCMDAIFNRPTAYAAGVPERGFFRCRRKRMARLGETCVNAHHIFFLTNGCRLGIGKLWHFTFFSVWLNTCGDDKIFMTSWRKTVSTYRRPCMQNLWKNIHWIKNTRGSHYDPPPSVQCSMFTQKNPISGMVIGNTRFFKRISQKKVHEKKYNHTSAIAWAQISLHGCKRWLNIAVYISLVVK